MDPCVGRDDIKKHMDTGFKVEKIESKKAPAALGPYSQALKFGNLVFCSGQIGLDPQTNGLVYGGVLEETKQALKNLREVLIASGSNLEKVLQTTIYIKDISKFAQVNEIYGKFFTKEPLPARATVEVSKLPRGASIEISCIAYT